MSSIISHFPDTDMRNSHAGLSAIAKKHKKDPAKLRQGDFLLFTNTRLTCGKLFASAEVIVHIRPASGRIDPAVIRHFPEHFNGTSLDYKGALKDRIEKYWKEKGLDK